MLPLCVGQRSILRAACCRYVRIVDAQHHISEGDDLLVGLELRARCASFAHSRQVGAGGQHIEVPFPQLGRPFCRLLLMGRVANEHQVMVGRCPQTEMCIRDRARPVRTSQDGLAYLPPLRLGEHLHGLLLRLGQLHIIAVANTRDGHDSQQKDVYKRQAFDEMGIRPNVKYIAREDRTILAMVSEGLGISLLPELMVRHSPTPIDVYKRQEHGCGCRASASPRKGLER